MSTEVSQKIVNYPAYTDLSSYQYHFVKLGTDNTVNLCSDGAQAIGVLQNKPAAAGRAAAVALIGGGGKTKVVVNGAVTRGDIVSSGSSGYANTCVSGDYGLGLAEETSTTSGQIITMTLYPLPGRYGAYDT